MSDFSISVRDVSVSYGNDVVLEDVNFDIKKGEFIAIVGKSGAGKSTLLNTLAGFIGYKGTVDIKDTVGFCFQSHSLFYWMTVAENIAFGLTGMNKVNKNAIVYDVIKKIDMNGYSNKYPKELSGGQMQRVALGRAIACNPRILLLDEPFSSLDIYTRDQMMDWVLKLIAEMNNTVLMVTHYLDEALVLADRVFVLKEKKISTEVDVLLAKPRTQATRFTEQFQKSKQHLAELLNHQ
jgi:ABC-type nitrate/sulfonate/bicarbonate transport system ATPase subunit